MLGGTYGQTLVGVRGDTAVMLTWKSCDGLPGSLRAYAIAGDHRYDLIHADDPIGGVNGEVGKLDTTYP